MITKQLVNVSKLNPDAESFMPFNLQNREIASAMQDVYDFFFSVNSHLRANSLPRLEDTLRPANLSGTISDMLTESLSKNSRTLVANGHHNGHPDLLVRGEYPNNSVKSGLLGVEIKSTKKPGGAVDTHGGRDQWMCVFVYRVDLKTEPAVHRAALRFTEVYLGEVKAVEFRNNARGELGTKTSTLAKGGITKLRETWVYLDR